MLYGNSNLDCTYDSRPRKSTTVTSLGCQVDVNKILEYTVDADKTINSALEGEGYLVTTANGVMRVKPSDIIEVLKEHAKEDYTEILPPEEDLRGWSIINATDEKGVSRPLFIIRSLPGYRGHSSYQEFERDDKTMSEIILHDVYKLTPFRIKWIMYKNKMRCLISTIKCRYHNIIKAAQGK